MNKRVLRNTALMLAMMGSAVLLPQEPAQAQTTTCSPACIACGVQASNQFNQCYSSCGPSPNPPCQIFCINQVIAQSNYCMSLP